VLPQTPTAGFGRKSGERKGKGEREKGRKEEGGVVSGVFPRQIPG